MGDAGFNAANPFRNSLAQYFLPSVDEWCKAAYYSPGGTYFDYPTGSDTAPTAVASGTTTGTAVYNQALATGPADVTSAGGLSPFGTMGQGGNVLEWEETVFSGSVNNNVLSFRGTRGGNWLANSSDLLASERGSGFPSDEFLSVGFRVASAAVPEPSPVRYGGVVIAGLVCWGIVRYGRQRIAIN